MGQQEETSHMVPLTFSNIIHSNESCIPKHEYITFSCIIAKSKVIYTLLWTRLHLQRNRNTSLTKKLNRKQVPASNQQQHPHQPVSLPLSCVILNCQLKKTSKKNKTNVKFLHSHEVAS